MEEAKLVKDVVFGEEARNQILKGVAKLTQAVSSTLGASGKCVILEDNNGKPSITKDGVTVANSIILQNPLENIGATLLKQAAQRTVAEAGDGTTTATVLAEAILKEATKIGKNFSTREIKEGILGGVKKVVNYLEKNSKKINGKKITQVATISANNDIELGKIIGEAFEMVEETGVVTMEINDHPDTYVHLTEGVEYDQPLKNHHFITDQTKGICELENPYVLLVESNIPNMRRIQNILEFVIKGSESLLIIAEVDNQVSNALAMNKIKGNLKVNIIDAPFYGINRKDILSDLALLTGATVINEDIGDDMDLIDPSCLGRCEKAISDSTNTILKVNTENNEIITDLISHIKKEIKDTINPNMVVRLERRLAKLQAKMATIKVGANSEVELREKRDRVEDAICATKAAIKEGILPGGGVALLNASQKLTPTNIGEEILYNAIKQPFEVILINAGIENIPSNMEKGKGLDVVTGKTVNMVKSGIIDPLLVTKSALLNAVSVATTILSTDCVINNIRA
jgi:chaperonin GroEL